MKKYLLKDMNDNKIEIYGTEDEFEIDGISFTKLEEINEIEPGNEIPNEKKEKYRSKGLVKSLSNDFSVDDINNKLKFCKFKLKSDKVDNISGVYIWVLDNEIIYIGETNKLKDRFNTGYGIICPRNIFKGGQSTNCKMNRVILNKAKENKYVTIYFHKTPYYKKIESFLLSKYKTEYNSKK